MLDYPIDLLPLVARGASLTNLAFVILYLVHITPSIFRFAQASLITWKILASVYGNFQTMIYVMTKLFDPVQFVLYWIALFASYLWFQYLKVQTIFYQRPSKFYQLTQNIATDLTGIYLNNACFVQNSGAQISAWDGQKLFCPFIFIFKCSIKTE